MRIELNNPDAMQINKYLEKLCPWMGLIGALCLIVPSLYTILDNPLRLKADHLVLVTGIFLLVLCLKELFDRIVNLKDLE